MVQKQIKRIKLHRKYRRYGNTLLNEGLAKQIPWLNVSGIWLQAAGFNAGDPVEITVENKMLTIKNIAADGIARN